MTRAILVQRNNPRSDESNNIRKLQELKELAKAAGYEVVSEVTQTKHHDKRYQIGKGKVEEIAELVQELGAEKIIFYNKLSTTQIYNISETCKCNVIDKFQLILDIFASRATTHRAKLQVELARLEYELPKARSIVSLLKKEEKPGFMGLGSYEDSYERDIKARISRIKNELKHVQKDSEALRARRHKKGFSLVALAGYTNAGKSTLFNTLVDENVQAQNMLFTTLSPTTRALDINGRQVLVTDTVGFIEDLPHWLVDAFKSTLEEIFLADVILLVVDMNEPPEVIRRKLVTSHDTMWDRVEGVPIITVLNKVDMISEEDFAQKLKTIGYLAPDPVAISGKEGSGLETLKLEIQKHLPKWERTKISLPMSEEGASMLSWLFEEGIVHNVDYSDRIVVDVEARDEVLGRARASSKELEEQDI